MVVSLLDDLEPLVFVRRRVLVAHIGQLSLEKHAKSAAGGHRGKVRKLVLDHNGDLDVSRDGGQRSDVANEESVAQEVVRPVLVAVVEVEDALCGFGV